MNALLAVRGLRTEFATDAGVVRAVNDVSITVPRGDVVGVVGESGSGKSVTARSILRMVNPPGRIVAGELLFDGRDLLTLSEKDMREIRGSEIAMVFQDPQSALNPVMTVGDQIAEALTVHGSSRKAARARALDLLRQVGIPDAARRLDDYPHQFSGGMRQRVVIAIALAGEPSLLIADEPTTALDVTIQAQILRLLGRLRDELGIAVLMITHDMGVVAETCDDVVVMYGGRVVEQGPVETVFKRQEHPYTADLLKAMPRLDAGDRRRLPAIPGAPPDPAALPAGCAFHPRCRLAEDRCRTELPTLPAITVEHAAACWVTQGGTAIPPLDVGTAAATDRAEVAETTQRRRCWRSRICGWTSPPSGAACSANRSRCTRWTGSACPSPVGRRSGWSVSRAAASRRSPARSSASTGRLLGPSGSTPVSSTSSRTRTRHSTRGARSGSRSTRPWRCVGVPRAERAVEASELMRRVGLSDGHLDRYPHAFSGGQRQRIGIARALAVQPKVLILDEPVSALDVSIQAQIINLLEELRDDLGLGYLFIAHDLSVVRHLSDRVAVMYLGRIVETGPVEAVYADAGAPVHGRAHVLVARAGHRDSAAGNGSC